MPVLLGTYCRTTTADPGGIGFLDQQRPLPDDALNAAADAFERLRPRLFGIAYRVLGSVSEAEDVVQDVWVRWQGADRSGVLDEGAFLARITTRLAINVAQLRPSGFTARVISPSRSRPNISGPAMLRRPLGGSPGAASATAAATSAEAIGRRRVDGSRVQPLTDEAEALHLANGAPPQGLAASVWTRDHDQGHAGEPGAADRDRLGEHPWHAVSEMPHGGVGHSG